MARGNGNATQDATDANANAPADGSEGVTDGSNEGGTESPKAKRSSRTYIVVPMPPDLKARFESEAEAADMPAGPYVLRNIIAKFLGIEIPVQTTARRSKYSSDDERKEAQKARAQSRSATMKNLMAEFRRLQASGVSADEAVARASAAVASGSVGADAGAGETASEPEAVPA